MAVKLTQEVKDNLTNVVLPMLEANRKHTEMSDWVGTGVSSHHNEDAESPAIGGCNTSACLAGFICLANGHTLKEMINIVDNDWFGVAKLATNLVGLEQGTVESGNDLVLEGLFFADDWPEPFRTDYLNAICTNSEVAEATKADVTIARFKHFIETGE